MSARHLIAVAAVAASLAACETVPMNDPGYDPRPSSAAFSTEDFGWSAGSGRGSIEGRVAFTRDGQAFACNLETHFFRKLRFNGTG